MLDLLPQRLRSVERLAGLGKQLDAAGIANVVFGHDPMPQGPAVLAKRSRRFD
jgi:hypothetical protein